MRRRTIRYPNHVAVICSPDHCGLALRERAAARHTSTPGIERLEKLLSPLLLCALTLVCGGWASQARASWNDDWAYRKEISFDLTPAGTNISGPLTDVPVVIHLSLGNFQYFNDLNPDASDFRLIGSDDKTALKFHVERFDTQTQIAILWVRVPQLSGGAKTDKIFLYYGNKKATSAADPGGTYDTNQALVYHFGPAKGAPRDHRLQERTGRIQRRGEYGVADRCRCETIGFPSHLHPRERRRAHDGCQGICAVRMGAHGLGPDQLLHFPAGRRRTRTGAGNRRQSGVRALCTGRHHAGRDVDPEHPIDQRRMAPPGGDSRRRAPFLAGRR